MELPQNAAVNNFLDDLSARSGLNPRPPGGADDYRLQPADESRVVRLVIFGDSWCRCDPIRTWPELFGDHMGWRTINVALPGSHSGTLEMQARLLEAVLERSGATLHPDAWVIVHTGGNDVLRAGPNDLIFAVLRTLCCCCCCVPGCSNAHWMLDDVADNIRELATKLREPPFGVRNLLLVGLPLCIKMPVVSKYLDFLLGVSPLLRHVGRFAVRRLNTLHLQRLRSVGSQARVQSRDPSNPQPLPGCPGAEGTLSRLTARSQLGGTQGSVITLDEAGAIETIVEAAEAKAASEGGASGASGGGNGVGGADARTEAEAALRDEDDSESSDDPADALWLDMLHPTQV